jgi:hypothetical protein
MNSFCENNKIIGVSEPKDKTGAAMTAKYVSMKDYGKLTILIETGAWAAGSSAISLLQATDVAATSAHALGFKWVWLGTAVSGLLTKTAVVSNTFLVDTALSVWAIEIDASDLDADHDCVTLVCATPGANADFYAVQYILSEPRFAQAILPTAILD